MNNLVFLKGIALANYRGISNKTAKVGPFQRFNFFIGQNNSGKSTFLYFIARHLDSEVMSRDSKPSTMADLDKNRTSTANPIMGIGLPLKEIIDKLEKDFPSIFRYGKNVSEEIITTLLAPYHENNMIWFKRSTGGNLKFIPLEKDINPLFAEKLKKHATIVRDICQDLTKMQGGNFEHWVSGCLSRIMDIATPSLPSIQFIPAIRQVSASGQDFSDLSGKGLIEELGRHQNPGYHEREKSKKFEAINDFVKAVTDNPTATIEIPHDREHILVHMDGKVLPLHVLGTGIHEVIMIAAACTIHENQIVCIEEPELHLHPLLQRRLIQYLEKKTTNQYFVATHSASIIDAAEAAVFHVSSKGGATQIVPSLTSSAKFEICRDLGYRASDMLQSNAIVWVEGPSDRIYMKHWIAAIDQSLREGVDYSIMFYGGRLLSHLSAAEYDNPLSEATDLGALIEVRQLNRHLCMIIDSDRSNAQDRINSTKQRILEELNGHGGMAWITQGREIENYVQNDLMSKALQRVYGSRFQSRLRVKQFDHVLPFKRSDNKIQKDIDKVAVARAVCDERAELNVLDLENRIKELVALIRNAQNH